MQMDVATFAKQIKQDGIDAARQEAEKIIETARFQAGKIEAEAREKCAKWEKDSAERIALQKAKSESELKLAVRDLTLVVKKRVEDIALFLLEKKSGESLSTEDVVRTGIKEIISNFKSGQTWELALGKTLGQKLAKAAVDNLFKTEEAKLLLVESLKKEGFAISLKGSNQTIELTQDSVIECFRRLLSPELSKIVDQSIK
ncbi:MAG: hypothetical protein HQM10_13275 [Candidatus Riflebacteria bacterium]|nr:hypothetical protein [Candidatus Riflebacteria bacterium]